MQKKLLNSLWDVVTPQSNNFREGESATNQVDLTDVDDDAEVISSKESTKISSCLEMVKVCQYRGDNIEIEGEDKDPTDEGDISDGSTGGEGQNSGEDEFQDEDEVEDKNMAKVVQFDKEEDDFGASFNHQDSAITIALCECIFSLLTDFSNYHLMLKFPFEHYHIMLSIVHKILIYQKRAKFRIKQWNAPFDALIKLIDYISRHFVRLGDLPSFQLANRALIVINFFITYGDTFLPNTVAYDFLYYEIARQSEVFCRLNSIAESTQASAQNGSVLGELSGRLINQLTNILAIVKHIRPKLESHSSLDPNAEEVIKIVQESFEDLTLKLYEGMETIERCENVDCQRYLFSIVENTMGRVKVNWSQENSVP